MFYPLSFRSFLQKVCRISKVSSYLRLLAYPKKCKDFYFEIYMSPSLNSKQQMTFFFDHIRVVICVLTYYNSVIRGGSPLCCKCINITTDNINISNKLTKLCINLKQFQLVCNELHFTPTKH